MFDTIFLFDISGSRTRLIRQFGGTGKQFGRMHDPRGIISTKDHEFYVTDSKNHRIQVYIYIHA